jgi:hypothetical protein
MPAWVLEGATTEKRRPVKGGTGWRVWLDPFTPLVWLAPYTIYVIIMMSIMEGN